MSGSVRLALTLLATVFVGWFAYKLIAAVIATVLSLVGSLAIVLVVAGALYLVISRKALAGGRRILP
jgi:hypothetical protein